MRFAIRERSAVSTQMLSGPNGAAVEIVPRGGACNTTPYTYIIHTVKHVADT